MEIVFVKILRILYSRIILNVNYKHNDKKMGANQILSKSIVDFRVSVGARGRY
jgi:hypothetical protein